jgi:hypothetical protein
MQKTAISISKSAQWLYSVLLHTWKAVSRKKESHPTTAKNARPYLKERKKKVKGLGSRSRLPEGGPEFNSTHTSKKFKRLGQRQTRQCSNAIQAFCWKIC